ncbi:MULTISPECIES: alkaline phosphatase [Dermacoccus]|uniref:alkaline phosphatase n=1 Tax=Dermacoccus TaxID=57495 RepID=UPI001F116F8B|nr:MULTISPECIES: alkaline phosphatase [Dermacoccus]
MPSLMPTKHRRIALATAVAAASLCATTAAASMAPDLSDHGGARRLHGDQTKSMRHEVKSGHPRNVILLIGDGMGDSEITSARNYTVGADGRLPGIDAMPMTGQYTTFSLTKDGKPDYVTDSAASGSGWATGTKTYNGAIGVDVRGKDQKNLLEMAKHNGLRTGNVSTAEIEDATPAVQLAHVTERGCYGPSVTSTKCPTNAKEKGGKGSIAEQALDTRPDVTLGGGSKTFDEKAKAGKYKDMTLRQQAQARGYQLPTTAADLAKIRRADQKHPVLGLFTPGNFEVQWSGPAATKDGAKAAPARCTPNPKLTASQPQLKDMTKKAINLLSDARGSRKGFFLQVEGASIDKRDHAADPCGQIGETKNFDEAVKAALDFAKRDGNTMVVVTADHGHTSQIVPAGMTTPGLTATLMTNEGAPMTLSYGTAPAGGSQEHTGTQVRVGAYGPYAANFLGLTDQTDMHFTIANALRLR